MGISITLEEYLSSNKVDYEVINHPRQINSSNTAESAHIEGDRLAKGVLLRDNDGYLLAVLPSTHKINLETLDSLLNRDLWLAEEEQVESLFGDCDAGAIPPIGAAYGVQVMLDDELDKQPDVYFEAGDHCSLVHVSGKDFGKLMRGAEHASFTFHT